MVNHAQTASLSHLCQAHLVGKDEAWSRGHPKHIAFATPLL
jgi:hypothetical protein